MKDNIGQTDKSFRLLLGVLILISCLVFQSWWALIGVVLILTALINWCPLYAVLGINTCHTSKSGKHGN